MMFVIDHSLFCSILISSTYLISNHKAEGYSARRVTHDVKSDGDTNLGALQYLNLHLHVIQFVVPSPSPNNLNSQTH